MQCKTLSHITTNGRKSYKYKEAFDTHEEAIIKCKTLNSRAKTIQKLVSYKCKMCQKYHTGRNGKKLTDAYKVKLNIELDIYSRIEKKVRLINARL